MNRDSFGKLFKKCKGHPAGSALPAGALSASRTGNFWTSEAETFPTVTCSYFTFPAFFTSLMNMVQA